MPYLAREISADGKLLGAQVDVCLAQAVAEAKRVCPAVAWKRVRSSPRDPTTFAEPRSHSVAAVG